MSIEARLKQLIIDRYGSAKAFAQFIDMPNSTLDNIFRRGVMNSNVTNIIKVCQALHISADALAEGLISSTTSHSDDLSQDEILLVDKYRALDQRGKDAVLNTLLHEYESASREEADILPDLA